MLVVIMCLVFLECWLLCLHWCILLVACCLVFLMVCVLCVGCYLLLVFCSVLLVCPCCSLRLWLSGARCVLFVVYH